MLQSATHTLRVRYGETDKMGFVYYGNYPEYFEVGRVELFRKLGISYKEMEDEGVLMPVLSLNIEYFNPLHYDEAFKLTTTLEKTEGLKVFFTYEIRNSKDKLCTKGSTTLLFIDKNTMRPIRIPNYILKVIHS